MKRVCFCVSLVVLIFAAASSAEAAVLYRNLSIGDKGEDVLFLQKILNSDPDTRISESGPGSPGSETVYFGEKTRTAVMKFQKKYAREVLYPASLYAPTGFVGVMTRAKLVVISFAGNASVKPTQNAGTSTTNQTYNTSVLKKPIISSVYPSKVRRGDKVTVYGENFAETGNIVTIATGVIWNRFSNLPSVDGKKIEFVYTPPVVNEMTEADFRALPPLTLAYLEDNMKKNNQQLSNLWDPPFAGAKNEEDVRLVLEKEGFSFDNLYYNFWMHVKNNNGEGETGGPILQGLRSFPWEKVAEKQTIFSTIKKKTSVLIGFFLPSAHADYGGGLNLGQTYNCNCSGGYTTFQISYGGEGMGTFIYFYENGFIPTVGNPRSINNWLGFFDSFKAIMRCWAWHTCLMVPCCLPDIPLAHSPKRPIGFSMWPSF